MEKAVTAAKCIRQTIYQITGHFDPQAAHKKAEPADGAPADKPPVAATPAVQTEHFFVATQDRRLVQQLRLVAGCPLVYIKMNAIHLDRPSEASKQRSKELIKESLVGREQLLRLQELKAAQLPKPEAPKNRRKVAKGPNPNSCKKKQKPKPAAPQPTPAGEPSAAQSSRKRKRSRQKVSKHIRTLLDKNSVEI